MQKKNSKQTSNNSCSYRITTFHNNSNVKNECIQKMLQHHNQNVICWHKNICIYQTSFSNYLQWCGFISRIHDSLLQMFNIRFNLFILLSSKCLLAHESEIAGESVRYKRVKICRNFNMIKGSNSVNSNFQLLYFWMKDLTFLPWEHSQSCFNIVCVSICQSFTTQTYEMLPVNWYTRY